MVSGSIIIAAGPGVGNEDTLPLLLDDAVAAVLAADAAGAAGLWYCAAGCVDMVAVVEEVE
jgi:hypothetical protein